MATNPLYQYPVLSINNASANQTSLPQWIPEVKDVCPGVPYLLIGCKNDLRTDSSLQLYLTVPGQAFEEPDSVNRLQVNPGFITLVEGCRGS